MTAPRRRAAVRQPTTEAEKKLLREAAALMDTHKPRCWCGSIIVGRHKEAHIDEAIAAIALRGNLGIEDLRALWLRRYGVRVDWHLARNIRRVATEMLFKSRGAYNGGNGDEPAAGDGG